MTSQKKKVLFVINPVSGANHIVPVRKCIEYFVKKDLFEYNIVETTHAGHATELASQAAAQGFDIVFAVGGDGTVNEVGCGVAGTQTALGILPHGSGNGLARHIGMPMDTVLAAKAINNLRIEKIDYGKINNRPFFCTCGVGFDAWISLKYSEGNRRGMLPYVEKALTEYMDYHNETYRLIVDGKELNEKAFIVTCANADQWGNNAYIAPHASLSDGLLDLAIILPLGVKDVPKLVFQLMNKSLEQNEHLINIKCESVKIIRNSEGIAHCDGDPFMAESGLDIGIVPAGMLIAVPQKKNSI